MRMSNVPAKIASALFVTAAIGLGAAATGLPDYTAKAADGCLTEPTRLEAGCWNPTAEADAFRGTYL